MAIPTSGYDSATISNPDSALTDFTLMIDLSRMSSSFKSAWNTNDNGRGRACKSDGTTELACDWIDLDYSNGTGLLRVKYSGTLASTGTQTIRIYPPSTSNTQYSASDTYGSDNAYDSNWEVYLPLVSDLLDRTSNSNDGTASGTLSAGDVTGKIGNATEFDSSDIDISNNSGLQITGDLTLRAWAYSDNTTANHAIIDKYWDGEYKWNLYDRDSGYKQEFTQNGDYDNILSDTISAEEWNFCAVKRDSNTLYGNINGEDQGFSLSTATPDTTTFSVRIGSEHGIYYFDGRLQHVVIESTARSDDWISEEYDQTDDQATFWGTWTWNSGSSTTYTLTADGGTYTLTGTAADLFFNRVLSADGSTYTLSGTDVDVLYNRVLTADDGSYTYSGFDLDLLFHRVLSAESGSYTYTGFDASLIYHSGSTYTLDAETGIYTLTGNDVDLLLNRVLSAEGSSFTLTGADAGLFYNRVLSADSGNFILTGTDTSLLFNRVLTADSGTYTLIGYDVILSYSGNSIAGKMCITITSTAPKVNVTSSKPEVVTTSSSPTITISMGGTC